MGSRAVRWLLISLAVVLVLVIAADRIGDVVAEGIAAETLQSSQHLSSEPDVDIAGFPFLTQLATGHYDKITVTAKDVPLRQARGLKLSRLQVVLHDLDVSRTFTRFHAATADATATISYGALSDVLGVELTYAGDGKVQATKAVSIVGHTLHPHITATPHLDRGKLSFADILVTGVSGLTGSVVDALTREFDLTLPLQNIPFQVTLQTLSAGPDGIILTLTGSDLLYVKGGLAPS